MMDGMDQKKSHLPVWEDLTKDFPTDFRLPVHVAGLLSYGRGVDRVADAHAFIDLKEFKQDSNLTINILVAYCRGSPPQDDAR
jgi:hypothetical protein